MTLRLIRQTAASLLLPAFLFVAGCATPSVDSSAPEPVIIKEPSPPVEDQAAQVKQAEPTSGEAEVPLAIAKMEPPAGDSTGKLPEVIVQGRVPERHEVISGQVAEARDLLSPVKLEYVFTGKGKKEVLRGRPVAFALWSETHQSWTIAHLEIPRPPIKWKPGGKPLPFIVRTAGIQAQHIKGTGAERLMFAFSKDGEQLKVYGRKFPVFDNALIVKKQWRAAVASAVPIVYLPFTEDTLDPQFVSGGKEYLLSTARKALEELRRANAPSRAFPGESLADVVPAEVLTTLAVIEQTDDRDFIQNQQEAVNEVLSHYGLKRDEAYRYSVSTAAALGPMQFTNKKGKGTYAMVVKRCPEAKIDPYFERGATDLVNAMKAAVCLFDLDLSNMSDEITDAYRENKQVLGIFPVASYNGGAKNVAKLYNVMKRMGLKLEQLSRPREIAPEEKVVCPCLWKETNAGIVPVTIPKYNNENRGYIQKYQSILSVFD
jgi:hypothetical protein